MNELPNILTLARVNPEFREGLRRHLRVAYPDDFVRSVSGMSFTQKGTQNKVKFNSLPPEEQRKIYQQWASSRTQPGGPTQAPKAPGAPTQPAAPPAQPAAPKVPGQQALAPKQPGQTPGVQLGQVPAQVGAPVPAAPGQGAPPAAPGQGAPPAAPGQGAPPAAPGQGAPAAPAAPGQGAPAAPAAPGQGAKPSMKEKIQKGLNEIRDIGFSGKPKPSSKKELLQDAFGKGLSKTKENIEELARKGPMKIDRGDTPRGPKTPPRTKSKAREKSLSKGLAKGLAKSKEKFEEGARKGPMKGEKKGEMPLEHYSGLEELVAFLEMSGRDPDARTDIIRDMHTAKEEAFKGGDKWKKMPKGWTDKSRKKFWDTLTGEDKHKVTECIKKMEGTSISNPGAFCASLADRVLGKGWRKQQVKEMLKTKRERGEIGPAKKKAFLDDLGKVAASLQQPLRTRRDYGEDDEEENKKEAGEGQMSMTTEIPAEYVGETENLSAMEAHRDHKKKRNRGEHEEAQDRAKKEKCSQMPGDGSSREETEVDQKLASDWLSYEEVSELCPPCASRMKKAGFKRVHSSVIRRMLLG